MGCNISKQNQSRHTNYQLLSLYKVEGIFLTLAINNINTLVAVGTNSEIKIFNFKRGFMKQIQIMQIRGYYISLLIYCKIKPFLISAQVHPSLIIWNNNLISNTKYICKLNGHSLSIMSMVIHPIFEDLIITGSEDNNIKFWSIKTQWYCKQTISEHSQPVISLIINTDGTQLISCSQDKSIFIIEGSNQTLWLIKQKIQLHYYGYRLSYITNSMFLFQPNSLYDGTHLYIYYFNSSKQQYQQLYQIPVKGKEEFCYYYFPSVYIKSLNLLVIKNARFVNILRITPSLSNNNLSYKWEQTIEFQNKYINGTLSDNGEFLLIWDEESEQIQIRQLQQNFTIQ
ncbi:unnamed protein product [Paramecium pentaurelia]|uniref:Uncharacterized protein n=1 Tax=Paramecium pentaurelia TaxID=43138 RepID=A0A8S1VCD7_9CILI|nr:unnamed protein product [Paramecium pentaurelia]